MRNRKHIFLVSFAVIFFLSATLVSAFQYKDQRQFDFLFSISIAAILALIGSAIGALVLPTIPRFEVTTPKIILIALRVCVIAVLVSFVGGGLAFAGFLTAGRVLAGVGIIIGTIIIFSLLIAKVLGLFKNVID